MTWRNSSLGELTTRDGGLIQTGPFGSQLHQSDYQSDGVPVIMPKDIANGRVSFESIARISEETANRLERHKIKSRSLVLPRRGDVTKRAFIRIEQEGWLCGTGCLKIEVNGKELVPEFLYYFMEQNHIVQWLEQHAVGTTMLNLSAGIVAGLPIRYPSIEVQNQIASTLSAYDDLIENNRRRMTLLEGSARLLYREWFVRLRFPGYEHTRIIDGVPEGWERKTLGNQVILNYGKALKADDRIDGPFPVYGSSGVVGTHNKSLVEGPGIILGRKGNVGSVYWCAKNFYPIDTVYFIDTVTSNLYLYYALKHMHFISTDVAVPGLNRNLAYSRPLIIPAVTIFHAFLETVALIHEQLNKLEEINQKLRAARDLLLPRLMSGEIAV
ncbi:restriction endonuclease subunit S, partial [Candidatus Contendibacter odensensis]|uniref:Type I restriction-modification system specificity subunit n=1 Tax=Candidatus Contendobacter odensis Run_B_J11 TaxID=1400861 RepID=A0A7U7GDG8_9GAMM